MTTERQGRQPEGVVLPGGLGPSTTLNIIQQPGFGVSLGAGQFVDINDLITMTAVAGTSGRYQTFQTLIGSAGAAGSSNYYQVPAGKRFLALASLLVPRGTSTAVNEVVLGYGDTGVNDTVAAPTNAAGRLIQTYLALNGGGAATSFFNEPVITSLYFLVPASKYPCAYFPVTSMAITLYGVERPA